MGTDGDGGGGAMALVDTLGRRTGPTLAVPRDNSGQYLPDAKGYLIFDGIGGYYDVAPDGMHRITTGALIAAGPTKLADPGVRRPARVHHGCE